MTIFEVPGVAIAHWEADVQCVRIEWLSFVNSSGFKEVMKRGVAECAARKAVGWIADTRNTKGMLSVDDQQFLVNYMPITRASGLRTIVTIRPRTGILTEMSNRRWQKNVADPTWSLVEVESLEEARAYCRKVKDAVAHGSLVSDACRTTGGPSVSCRDEQLG